MNSQCGRLVILVIAVAWWLPWADGLQQRVGDSIWSIPAYRDFYTNWSSSQSFQIGDTLVFDFQSDFHNVLQVSRIEYEDCTADNPFQSFWYGPATVPLVQVGVYYFICSVGNYCVLGQKVSVTVHPTSPTLPSPPPSPSPPPLPPPPTSAPSPPPSPLPPPPTSAPSP
ncbi:mavicyanin-like [Macadamia integrifolia]|uniref:mavicyanin-like n=1 Tax=Macadamia integrifolia TaxID=60698 RepID=UPI001C528AFF|nr:mavicyanin-like [Macadamia integrifolia]